MQQQRKALGRGLDALFGPPNLTTPTENKNLEGKETVFVPLEKIFPNREQPRTEFNEEALQELALSIKQDGLLQPLLVTPVLDGRFELIAGERRWRASKMAGLSEVPVIIHKEVGEKKRLELALVENIQREDLNAIEEAKGYQSLAERFHLSHADISERVGKSREHIANTVRLLKLPKVIQEDVTLGKMRASHARALLALSSLQEQLMFREKILEEILSVRDVERLIQERGSVVRKKRSHHKKNLSPQTKLLLDDMERALGTKVKLQMGAVDGRGLVLVEFYSWQDLDRIYKKVTA